MSVRVRRRRRPVGGVGEEIRRRHAWIDLLQTSGPVLTLPVVHRVFPNGLPGVAQEHRARLRALVSDMLDDHGASHHAVIEATLRDVLDWQDHLLIDAEIPDALTDVVMEHRLVLRPDFAFHAEYEDGLDDDGDEADDDDEVTDDDNVEVDEAEDTEAHSEGDGLAAPSGPWRLLGMYAPWGAHPLDRMTTGGWTASPVERLATLLRARDVPIGLVTDGRWWALVWAPRGGATGAAVWDAALFSEEPQSLQAFVALLQRSRFLAQTAENTLPGMLIESLERQEEVTETLGRQVRDAVEMLVGKLDELDRRSEHTLLADVDDDELYAGVVTVMMRVVFLLFAEERRLLPSDDDVYVNGYSVGQLVDQLEQRASLAGEQELEHRTAAWHRLLAVARAVYAGVAHEDLRLPAYGGDLFDPDRHPWLEGRHSEREHTSTQSPAVDDRTVLRMLRAVQYVEIEGARRRLTFRALDVEQIGYVYEGLLELEVRTADDTTLGFIRPSDWPRLKKAQVKAETCEATLRELAEQGQAGDGDALAAWVSDRCAWPQARVSAALGAATPQHREALDRALGGARHLIDAIEPVAEMLRYDELGLPAITPPGGRYVSRSTRRATTGTHYTPRSLAEEVITHALEPLVYRPGPLETPGPWQIRPSSEILQLRLADIAMGSGAFLVAACRYLADRLVEAWEAEGRQDALRVMQQRAGRRLSSDAEIEQVLLDARRLVADRCLYGVDINPLAVEMAKLSLWLVTMDRERPFGFLDDRLVGGDSLLGLVSVEQLEELHIDPVAGRRLHDGALDFTEGWRPLLQRAADLRRRITAAPVITIRDVEHKARLLHEATALNSHLRVVADAITAVGLTAANLRGRMQDSAFVGLSLRVPSAIEDDDDLNAWAHEQLQTDLASNVARRQPLHWPIAFPEIFADDTEPGFDVIVGNPPFLGGQKLSGALGDAYLKWLQRWDGNGVKGSADLAARFVLRAERLLNRRGQLGYVAVNTLVQGKTLLVGLEQATQRSLTMRRGRSSHPWPARGANLEIVEIWASKIPLGRLGVRWLDDEEVPQIGPDLEPVGSVTGRPYKLKENEGIAFQGSNILGQGFTMTAEQKDELIARDPRNADILQPYVIGKDLNQRSDCSASRWVINFRDWSLEQAEQYPDLIDIVRRLVKPKRDRNRDRQRREIWWRFTRPAPELYAAISEFDHVLAISLLSSAVMPVRVPTGQVFAHKCAVFALDDFGSLALLSSNVHTIWVIRYTSTVRRDINYSPSDVFLTFPRPRPTTDLENLGRRLDTERRELMLSRGWNLKRTYNRVHDPANNDPAVQALRQLHADIDRAVLDAYRWHDLDWKIGHHQTKVGPRWTASKEARFDLLDLLLAENHRRHERGSG